MAKLLAFKAWIDKMPGHQPKLIVTGQVEVPTSGWTGSLARAAPQGTNPKVLILDARLQKPGGMVNQVISQLDLRYEESPPAHEYTDVTVRLGTDQVTVTVEIVQ